MSGSNCCFLTCIQISQEAGQVVWYYNLFKNFPQFVYLSASPNNYLSVPTLNEACVQEKRNQAKKSASLKDHERLG